MNMILGVRHGKTKVVAAAKVVISELSLVVIVLFHCSLDADMDARVRIMPKLHTYTNLKVVTFTERDERAIVDWSLGAHYALNKQFSFFLDAHNLLGRRYFYYTGYPSQGFNILAGAMFKF